jgi:hypothetical protein
MALHEYEHIVGKTYDDFGRVTVRTRPSFGTAIEFENIVSGLRFELNVSDADPYRTWSEEEIDALYEKARDAVSCFGVAQPKD